MSNFKIPKDTKEHRSGEMIAVSVSVLNLLKGKTFAEIQDIFSVSSAIIKHNVKLL